jgi:hypothetical protein
MTLRPGKLSFTPGKPALYCSGLPGTLIPEIRLIGRIDLRKDDLRQNDLPQGSAIS